jgi:hypothetical protein
VKYPVPKSFKDPPIEIPWKHRPERVARIQIHRSVERGDRLWESDNGGWVAGISSDHVAEVVRTKAEVAPLARRSCDELWLVIANDVSSNAAPAEISKRALEATYEAPFDRLIWLLPTCLGRLTFASDLRLTIRKRRPILSEKRDGLPSY